MEYNQIRELLNRYFEGNTTLEEEAILRNYFSDPETIHPDFEFARDLFMHWIASRQVEYEGGGTEKSGRGVKNRSRLGWISVAASVCLLVIAGLFWPVEQQTVYAYIDGKPVTDKEIALAEMEKALGHVSQELNRGTSEFRKISKYDEIEGKVFKRE